MKDKEILQEALNRYEECMSANRKIYDDARSDIDFALLGEQWPDEVITGRQRDGRPCLTVNKLYTFVNQVDNDLRQGTPEINVRPVDGSGDPDTAEIIGGLIKNIYYSSSGEMAVDTASFYAVSGGFGFFRLLTDYEDNRSFDQVIKYESVASPFDVMFPFHLCKEQDFSDAPYCFVTSRLSKDEFKLKYKDRVDCSFESAYPLGWSDQDSILVAEYFYVEEKTKTIYRTPDGTIIDERVEGLELESRETVERSVRWCLITGVDILDKSDFVADRIPVFPIVGKCVRSDDDMRFISLVRYAKDPQRMYNYWTSAETESIALAPIAPIVAAEGQLEGHEGQWSLANKKSVPYLEYKPITLNGTMVPPPQRQMPVQPANAIINARGEAADDIKATTGIFDASLGSRGNETSGRAIIARQREGDKANYHFTDNRARAIRSAAKMIIDMIPKVYSGQRIVRILGNDMAEKVVGVNAAYGGQEQVYDLSVGRYDVVVDIGPAYATARTEAAENMLALVQSVPGVGQVSADLIVENLDFPNSASLASRLKRMIPPQLLSEEEREEIGAQQQQGPGPEEMAQIISDFQAMQEENAALKSELVKLSGDKQEKERDRQARLTETIIKADVDLRKAGLSAIPRMTMAGSGASQQAEPTTVE